MYTYKCICMCVSVYMCQGVLSLAVRLQVLERVLCSLLNCQTAKTNHEKDVTFNGISIGMQNLFSTTHALHALLLFYTR